MATSWQPQVGERVVVKVADPFYGIEKGATGIIDDIKHTWGQTVYYFHPDDPHPINHIPYMLEQLEKFIVNQSDNKLSKCVCNITDLMIRGCNCGGL